MLSPQLFHSVTQGVRTRAPESRVFKPGRLSESSAGAAGRLHPRPPAPADPAGPVRAPPWSPPWSARSLQGASHHFRE